jgi:acyl-CoA thioesterase
MTAVRPDTFAALLGIEARRLGDGAAEAEATVGADHLNPHGTAHGTFLYTLGGVALAAAANDEQHSGLVSSVHIDYLRPAHHGDRLVARAELVERTAREDLYVVRVLRAVPAQDDELVARLSGRASRRARRAAG